MEWMTQKEAGDNHIRYWFEAVNGETRVTYVGLAPTRHDSAAAFERDIEELRERYENNVTEMLNLHTRFE